MGKIQLDVKASVLTQPLWRDNKASTEAVHLECILHPRHWNPGHSPSIYKKYPCEEVTVIIFTAKKLSFRTEKQLA